jgi:hypothetical protein
MKKENCLERRVRPRFMFEKESEESFRFVEPEFRQTDTANVR